MSPKSQFEILLDEIRNLGDKVDRNTEKLHARISKAAAEGRQEAEEAKEIAREALAQAGRVDLKVKVYVGLVASAIAVAASFLKDFFFSS